MPFRMKEWLDVCLSYKYGNDIGLKRLSNQSKIIWAEICLWSKKIFFSAVFSRQFFHQQETQVKGKLFNCPQIWTVAILAYKKIKSVCDFFISKFFFEEQFFFRLLHICLILFRKCSAWTWLTVTGHVNTAWLKWQETWIES